MIFVCINPPTPGDARGSAPGKRGVNSNSNNNSSNNGDPLAGGDVRQFLGLVFDLVFFSAAAVLASSSSSKQ